MKLVLSATLIGVILTCASSASKPRIRDVDFKNFTFNWYPRWANSPPAGRKVVLTNGDMDTGFSFRKEPRECLLIDEPVKYGDLTRDGNEDAVVVLGIITSGTARPGVVFVYRMSHGKPRRLLAYETGDRWDYGYHGAWIGNGELIVERYKPYILVYHGQKHNMSSSNFYVRDHYKWTGRRFRKIKSQVVPVDSNDRAPWAHTAYNNSLDASGGSVFLNRLGGAKGALIRAAASTQPLCS